CLEANLSEPILFACEKAIFAGAETVAAATAYVTASLALLSDGSATGVDADYDAALAALRRRLEIDRFGFLAQVLAGEGCSAASCEKFALFADTSRIGAHLKARTLENLIARYSASWPQPALTAAPGAPAAPAAPAAAAAPPAPVAAAPAAPGGAPHAGNAINFPSAASIPPVSIMIEEPSHPASTGGIAPAVGAQKRPPGPSRLPPAPARAQA